MERGAIDFDTQEAKILVDEKGAPTEIVLRERGVAERLIESFMLAAIVFTKIQIAKNSNAS